MAQILILGSFPTCLHPTTYSYGYRCGRVTRKPEFSETPTSHTIQVFQTGLITASLIL